MADPAKVFEGIMTVGKLLAEPIKALWRFAKRTRKENIAERMAAEPAKQAETNRRYLEKLKKEKRGGK